MRIVFICVQGVILRWLEIQHDKKLRLHTYNSFSLYREEEIKELFSEMENVTDSYDTNEKEHKGPIFTEDCVFYLKIYLNFQFLAPNATNFHLLQTSLQPLHNSYKIDFLPSI